MAEGVKIQIIKCSNDQYWYIDKIGEIFTVYDIVQGDYRVKQGLGAYCVLKSDCKIIS